MMGLSDRVSYFILGMVVGLILGYIIKSLHNIDEKVTEVDDMVKEQRDERGFMTNRLIADSLMILTLIVVVYSAVAAQLSLNTDRENRQTSRATTQCNSQILNQTVLALNERTTFSAENSQASVDLAKGQLEFLTQGVAGDPPPSASVFKAALQNYVARVDNYVEVNEKAKAKGKALRFQYPEKDALLTCIDKKVNK